MSMYVYPWISFQIVPMYLGGYPCIYESMYVFISVLKYVSVNVHNSAAKNMFFSIYVFS